MSKLSLKERVRRGLRNLSVLVLVAFALTVMVWLNFRGLGFLWSLFALVCAIVLFCALRFERPLPVVSALFPVIKDLIARERQLRENTLEIQKVQAALEPYGSWPARMVPEKLAEEVPATESDVVKWCVDQVAKETGEPPEGLLQLLQEHTEWPDERDKLAPYLAQKLSKPGALNLGPETFGLGRDELERLIRQQEVFRTRELQQIINSVENRWHHACEFLEYLDAQGVPLSSKNLRAREVLDLSESGRNGDAEASTFWLFVALGKERIKSEPELVENVTLVAIALFAITRGVAGKLWRNHACVEAARHSAAHELVLAYLVLKSRAEQSTEIALGNVLKKWHATVEEWKAAIVPAKGHRSAYELEIENIRGDLVNEHWPTSLRRHIAKTVETAGKVSPHTIPILRAIQRSPRGHNIERALRRVCNMLNNETIKRFLETRTVHPYLLTFDSRQGSVAGLLNYMLAPENLPQELRISLQGSYRFETYTSSARIGVAPKGKSFTEFCESFEADFKRLVSIHDQLVRMKLLDAEPVPKLELIIHEFELSAGRYFGFAMGVARDKAMESLKTLFGGILAPEEILALVEYEGRLSLLEAMMNARLTDLVGQDVGISAEQKKALDEKDDALRSAICRLPGASENSPSALGGYYAGASKSERRRLISEAARHLKAKLGQIAGVDERWCSAVAASYLDTLEAISRIHAESS